MIALYPTPGKKGATHSQSFGEAESVGVIMSDHDYEGTFGVVFHELCHSLYQAQSIEFQNRLEKSFLSQNSKFAVHAYELLNEGLATALGNGWAFQAATGKLDEHRWYNDRFINDFSKAVFPWVEEYLKDGKTLDERFARLSTAALEKALPDSIYEFEGLFQHLIVAGDGGTVKSALIKSSFQKEFRVNDWDMDAPMDTEKTIEAISKSHHTFLGVFTRAESRQLPALSEKIPLIKAHLKALMETKSNFLFSALDPQGRAIVLVQISKAEDWPIALGILKTRGKIDPKKEFQLF